MILEVVKTRFEVGNVRTDIYAMRYFSVAECLGTIASSKFDASSITTFMLKYLHNYEILNSAKNSMNAKFCFAQNSLNISCKIV